MRRVRGIAGRGHGVRVHVADSVPRKGADIMTTPDEKKEARRAREARAWMRAWTEAELAAEDAWELLQAATPTEAWRATKAWRAARATAWEAWMADELKEKK